MLSTRVGTSAPRLNARAPPQHYDLHRITVIGLNRFAVWQ